MLKLRATDGRVEDRTLLFGQNRTVVVRLRVAGVL
jgi:hypothetical protein